MTVVHTMNYRGNDKAEKLGQYCSRKVMGAWRWVVKIRQMRDTAEVKSRWDDWVEEMINLKLWSRATGSSLKNIY